MNTSSLMGMPFKTKDLAHAAYLHVSGVPLSGLESGPRFVYFVFNDLGRCERLTQLFWSGDGAVSAKAYSIALRELKARIHAHGI